MLIRVEQKQFQAWLEVSYILLNIPISGQEFFERDVANLKTKMSLGTAEFPHNWFLMGSQDEKRCFYITGYCYHDIYFYARNDVISDILVSESTGDAERILVIGMNINKENCPYSILGCRLSAESFDNKYLKMISAHD